MIVLSIVRKLFRTTFDVLYGLYLTIKDTIISWFKPKPKESDIEDMNYYRPTEDRPKLYDKDDGEYVRFKEL